MKTVFATFAMAAIAALFTPSVQAQNQIAGNWSLLQSFGAYGTLRAGSPWGPGSGVPSQVFVADDLFVPEHTQWNASGSWWWDQDPTVNDTASYPQPMGIRIELNNPITVNRFVVQADDNDSYQLDYWDGSAWVSAFSVAAVGGFGMVTRDSGEGAFITTSQLRFYATGGDNYYGVSEIQAFGATVPEPNGFALVTLALLGVGALGRRRATPGPNAR